MSKCNEAQKPAIIYDYIASGNFAAVGRKYGVTPGTVRYILKNNPKIAEACRERLEKGQPAPGIPDAQAERQKSIMDKLLGQLEDDGKIGELTAQQAASIYGALADRLSKSGGGETNVNIIFGALDSEKIKRFGK